MMKSNCKKHKKTIEKYDGELRQLAEDIGDLHYETLTQFLYDLQEKLEKDSLCDKQRQRHKLSKKLYEASNHLASAGDSINEAWEISKPYMIEKHTVSGNFYWGNK